VTPAVAVALLNVTVPKSVSGSVRYHLPSHAEGASAIHSADETSGDDMCSVLVNPVPRVRSRRRTTTVCPDTDTDAETTSPARTDSRTRLDAAGTSSYQTVYRAVPAAVQSEDVPTCSSESEDEPKPPSPTQNAEYVSLPAVQVAVGTVQLPETLVNGELAPATAYPAQLQLANAGRRVHSQRPAAV
jgi:hypothetical protein